MDHIEVFVGFFGADNLFRLKYGIDRFGRAYFHQRPMEFVYHRVPGININYPCNRQVMPFLEGCNGRHCVARVNPVRYDRQDLTVILRNGPQHDLEAAHRLAYWFGIHKPLYTSLL